MIITDKKLSIEKKMVEYLDRIALRVSRPAPKLDYAMLVDGPEGYGKTNIGITAAYRVGEQTGREFTLDNIFFDPEKLIKFATENENKIIMWDEMALVALAMQHGDKWQLAIIQTLMMARKKRHFFIFCIPRFYRLREAIIERCMGMIHVYARSNMELGRFFFYKKSALDSLYETWKRTKRKPKYWQFVTVRGCFGESLSKVIDEKTYEKSKDEAIMQILERMKGKKMNQKTEEIRKKLAVYAKVIHENRLQHETAERLGKDPTIIYHDMKMPGMSVPD